MFRRKPVRSEPQNLQIGNRDRSTFQRRRFPAMHLTILGGSCFDRGQVEAATIWNSLRRKCMATSLARSSFPATPRIRRSRFSKWTGRGPRPYGFSLRRSIFAQRTVRPNRTRTVRLTNSCNADLVVKPRGVAVSEADLDSPGFRCRQTIGRWSEPTLCRSI